MHLDVWSLEVKKLAELLTLIPLVIPGMIIALFFSRMLLDLNINNPFIGIVIGHVVLTLPYAIRILSAGFSSVPQDLIDASRDLGASKFTVFKDVYMPMLKPSFLASIIFCLVKVLKSLLSLSLSAHQTLLPCQPFYILSSVILLFVRMRPLYRLFCWYQTLF